MSEPKDFPKSLTVIITVVIFCIGVLVGSTGEVVRQPTHYANGYCAALGGVAINDELCNVNGHVEDVKR